MFSRLCLVLGLIFMLSLGLVIITPPQSEAGPVWRWATRGVRARMEYRQVRRAEYQLSRMQAASCGGSQAYQQVVRSSNCGGSQFQNSAVFQAPVVAPAELPVSPGVGDRAAPAAPPYRGASLEDYIAKPAAPPVSATSPVSKDRCGEHCICGEHCNCTNKQNCTARPANSSHPPFVITAENEKDFKLQILQKALEILKEREAAKAEADLTT